MAGVFVYGNLRSFSILKGKNGFLDEYYTARKIT
jgi:hypothetical protein